MSDEFLVAAQETRALVALEAWVARKPGRGITVHVADGRWRATLADSVEVGGNSLPDVLAKAAQVVVMEAAS